MTASDLQGNIEKLNKGVAFLIRHSQRLFKVNRNPTLLFFFFFFNVKLQIYNVFTETKAPKHLHLPVSSVFFLCRFTLVFSVVIL